jgi:parallel beta-helix repeat protein
MKRTSATVSVLSLALAFMLVVTQAPRAEAAFTQVNVGLETSGSKAGGVSWGDFNEDGCLDALVNTTNAVAPDVYTRLYRSDCHPTDPTFVDVTAVLAGGLELNLTERSALWGDLDNDGLLDIAVNGTTRIEIYFNNGPGAGYTFGTAGAPDVVFTALGGGMNTEGMGIIDFDGDGDLDLIFDNHDFGIDVLENDGLGGFTHATPNGDPGGIGLPETGLSGDYAAATDLDRDGDVDLIVRKEGLADIWVNVGGTFSAAAFDQPASNTNKGGVSFCDFDNDGDFDVFWTDNGTNQVWRNDAGAFVATAQPAGAPAAGVDGVACGDTDNDGRVDLFLTTDGGADLLFPNTSTGPGVVSFGAAVSIGAGNGEGAAFGDYDRDGDLDLLVNRHLGLNQLWRNDAYQGGAIDYVNVDVQYDLGGGLSRGAIGATVRLLACDGSAVSGVREVNGGRGHGSQDPALVHFGLPLGSAQRYIVEARFPTGETTQNVIVPSAIGGYRVAQVTNTTSDVADCQLSGTVFEDLAGNALDGAETVADASNPGVPGVDVWLYRDDGGVPNVPDAADTFAAGPIATSGSGAFSFGAVDGTYWVVVDSQDLASAPAWAEQTYGPDGGWCADGASGTTERAGAGPCYGGRRDASSDDLATWHTGAEHIARVVVSGAGVTSVDFGFSFNVVTSTRGGDATIDPGATGAQTIQGSLRQFMQNANNLAGPNAMRFVPAEPTNATDGGGNDWWRISFTAELPPASDSLTTIDGTAYNLSDGVTVRNTNTTLLGTGGTVGTEAVALGQVAGPELEVVGDRSFDLINVLATVNDFTLRRVASWGFIRTVENYGDRLTVEDNVLGASAASFTDPGAGLRQASHHVYALDAGDGTIQNNLLAYSDGTGVAIYGALSTGWQLLGNEVRSNAKSNSGQDGFALHQSMSGVTIEDNLVIDNAGFGVDLVGNGGGATIRNNTITGNGHGNGTPTQIGGIRVMGSNSLFEKNVIAAQEGPGIIVSGTDGSYPGVTPAANNRISQNSFTGNGSIGIDLEEGAAAHTTGDGVTPNDGGPNATFGNLGVDYPVLTSAHLAAGDLLVAGTSPAGAELEFYISDGDVTGFGEGETYLVTRTEGSGADLNPAGGAFSFRFSPAPGAVGVDDEVTALSIDATNNTSEFGVNVTVNGAPTLDPVGDRSVDELSLLSFTATGSDPNAGDGLTFSLNGAPVGAAITSGGDFTWTPTEAQGPGSYVFDVVVTDDGTPNLNDSETITVTVSEDNAPPILDPVGDQSVDELSLLSFTATASDPDVPPNSLVFSLSGAPVGASITAGGDFTWTPTEAQGPGSYVFDVVVTETDGSPNLADSETITVTVGEINVAPVLDPVGDQSIDELVLLSFTATASDVDLPANTLTFSLSGAPAGASITAGGDFTWTPTEAQGPGSYVFDVVVTDNGTPNLNDSENEINVAPVLDPVGDQSVDELSLLSFTAAASDVDVPANTLTFSLSGAPAGASMTAGGDFTWTPTEAQGPGSYVFDVVVTDDGTPNLADSETITVTVGEVNVAPVLDPVGDRSVDELSLLSFTATASDPDVPPNSLVFSLSGAPVGASITAGGDFTWTPTEAQGPGSYVFDVIVTDNGTPNLADSESITVTVGEVNVAPVLGFIGNRAVDELTLLSFTATASDSDVPANTLTFSLSGAPAGASITAGGDFTWTPTEAQGPGSYVFDVIVTDDGTPNLNDSETITVTVGEDNVAPTLDPVGDQSVDELSLLSFTATASDPDAPANTLLFSLVGAPAGAIIDPNTGDFTWTPTEAQGPGSYVFDVVLVKSMWLRSWMRSETRVWMS